MMLCVVLSLGVSFFVVVYDQAKYREAVESRELSLKLAEELRQSSSDLARLVRTYVITGKQIYKDQFHAIVDIREGRRARPKNYSSAYWEHHAFATSDWAEVTESTGDAIPLFELMRQAGVTQEELENLKKSKNTSDKLVILENQAMSLVEEDVPVDPC